MILVFINSFQILNINLLMNFKLEGIILKSVKCNYDIIEDLMNINEADQTYSLISRIKSDNLMRLLLFSFLQQRTFIFIMKNYLYI